MTVTPLQVLVPLFLGLYAAIAVIGSCYLMARAAQKQPQSRRRRIAAAATGLVLASSVLLGRGFISLMIPAGSETDPEPFSHATRRLRGPGGADLALEEKGPADAPRLIFTHGWGADRREWQWMVARLSQQFHVITWDLPGLGESSAYPNADYDLNHMAADLRTIVEVTGDTPAILVGHSIGGMINLTLCRQFRGDAPPMVAGLVQLNTTYTNPLRTTRGYRVHERLKPVYEPLLRIVTGISPVVRSLNWLAYQSGLTHLYTAYSSFAGTEDREMLDFVARFPHESSPAVVARGGIAMMNWDASDVLERITIPVLVVSGAQDTTTLPSASNYMVSKIPQGLSCPIAAAAHLGPIEQHERYAEVIETFALSRLKGERQASRSASSR